MALITIRIQQSDADQEYFSENKIFPVAGNWIQPQSLL